MKLIAAALIMTTTLVSLSCESAEARWWRHPAYWNRPTPQEVNKEKRANMAERTHQIKELQESARINREREKYSSANTVHQYGKASPRKLRTRKGLVHRPKSNSTSTQSKSSERSSAGLL